MDDELKCCDLYKQAAAAEQCTWLADEHQVFEFGKAQLQILTGNEIWSDVNDYSVVARLNCGEVEFLFTGDAQEPAESFLTGDISADILKVGHPGSGSSTSATFLARVKPQTAIISVGKDNDYGHPATETLAKLGTIGATIYAPILMET